MARLLYLPFDQLHRGRGVLRGAQPGVDRVLMVESQRMVSGRKWHLQRLWYLVACAQRFARELEGEGFEVIYLKAATTQAGIEATLAPGEELWAAEQKSFGLQETLAKCGAQFLPNDFFLTPRSLFLEWAHQQKSHLMENFYRKQRIRLGILVDGGKPVGGQWNFDHDNRKPLPKNYSFPPYFTHERDELDQKVLASLKKFETWGDAPDGTWATSRAGALAQAQYFFEHHFAQFGPYEDAMSTDNWAVHHSLLSPYLNNGLLLAEEVVAMAVEQFNAGKVSIESCEGFIRQIIGWREYINGMYWFFGDRYRHENHFNSSRPLLPLFEDPSQTKAACLSHIVSDLQSRSWVHHIPRLMVLSNIALLTGVNPQEFLDWMRRVFIDAADWVMVPNVIGMGLHADGGAMMTKPYISGGAYISRMSNFCSSCIYDPKKRTGEDACPFTSLYWNFLHQHREELIKNHRIAQQVRGLDRLSDLDETLKRSQDVLEKFSLGQI